MAGFMAGFGEGFSNTFSTGMAAREQRKNDEFRLGFDNYLKNKDRNAARKAEEQKNIKLSHSIAEGLADAPRDAWVNIKNDLDAGLTVDQINKKYENGDWSPVSSNTASQVTTTGSQGPVQSDTAGKPAGTFPTAGITPVDQEMQNSGMANASTPAPAPDEKNANPQKKGGSFPNLLSGLSGKFQNEGTGKGAQPSSAVQKRIANASGDSPEEVAQNMSSTPYTTTSTPNTVAFKARAVSKADPINNLNTASIEQAAAARDFQKRGDDASRRRLEVANERVNALQNAATFQATTKANAERAAMGGLEAGVTAAIMGPEGEFIEIAPIIMKDGKYLNAVNGNPIQGNPVIYSDDEAKMRRDIFTEGQKERDQFNKEASEIVPMVREAAMLNDISRRNPNVLRGGVAGLAQSLTGFQEEARGVFSVLSQERISPDQVAQVESYIDGMVEKANSGVLPEGVTQLAQDKNLFEASRLRLALSLAKATGQGSGRDLSNADLERALATVSGNDPQALMENISSGIGNVLTSLEAKGNIISNFNSRAAAFEGATGKPSGFVPIKADVRQLISDSSDPLVSRGYEMIRQGRPDPAGASGVMQRAQGNMGVSSQPMSQPSTPITATGPNGQKIVLQNGQWVPMQ